MTLAKLVLSIFLFPVLAFGQISITQLGSGGGGSSVGFSQTPAAVEIPEALGWNASRYPYTLRLADMGPGPATGYCSVTPEEIFDAHSTARSAPGATFYVDVALGSNSNNGLTAGAAGAFKSIWKAVQAANTAAVPTKIFVEAGVYSIADNFSNGVSAIQPLVDIAFIATSTVNGAPYTYNYGRVTSGSFDLFAAPSVDATYVNCYSYAVTNVSMVVDLTRNAPYGTYQELTQVTTAALCNTTPNSWALVSGTIFINRGDGVAVTNVNTRVYRSNGYNFRSMNSAAPGQLSFYFGGATDNDGFDFEGNGPMTGCLTYQGQTTAGLPASKKALVIKNCAFRYSSNRGLSVDGIDGICAVFNSDSGICWSDGFNFHNSPNGTNGEMHVLTVNCTGTDFGRNNTSSGNAWTTHETVRGIDLAGIYKMGRGGTVRSIQSSKSLLVGTYVENDLGDMTTTGGAVTPTAFQFDSPASAWLDRVKIVMPASTWGVKVIGVGASQAKVYMRNLWPHRTAIGGDGTVSSY